MSERLWAPWRMEYVGKGSDGHGCLFCTVRDAGKDAENLVLLRNDHALLMLNAYPYTNGHLMAVPLRHTADFASLSQDEARDLMALSQRGTRALAAAYGPDGYNIGLNLGSAAGAGIADHLHVHIVPRWSGDTNFMAAVGDVRVLPEGLEASYERIAGALRDEQP